MRRRIRTLIMIGLLGLTTLLSGCALERFITPVDGGGMINTAAPLLNAIQGEWASPDGRVSLTVEGFDMTFILDGINVLNSGCYIDFGGEDTNIHTDFHLYNDALKYDGTTEFGVIEAMYYENTSFTLILSSEDGEREAFVLSKTEQADTID